MNSTFCWLLIWPVLTYGLIATNFWSQVSTLIRFWTHWLYRCLVRFLQHKMVETCWGLNTRSEAHFLSFPTPTQTNISNTHSHSYGHFRTAACGVSGLLKIRLSNGLEPLARLRTTVRLWLFKLVIKLGWLGVTWCNATCPNRPHQNKDNSPLLRIVRTRWQNALNTRY
jgi:hypothetical protein